MDHKSIFQEVDTESTIEKTLLLCWTWLVQISISEKTWNLPVYKLTHHGLSTDEEYSQPNDSIIDLDFILRCFKQELSLNSSAKFSSNIPNDSIAQNIARHTENFFKQNSIVIQVLYGLIYGILMYRDTGPSTAISKSTKSFEPEVIQLDFYKACKFS
jgi:hypothetical protein